MTIIENENDIYKAKSRETQMESEKMISQKVARRHFKRSYIRACRCALEKKKNEFKTETYYDDYCT